MLTWFHCVYSYPFSLQLRNSLQFLRKAEPVDLSNIPEEYHEFQDVFGKTKAGNLAPHCPYDLKIDLEENAEPPLRRMYLLSEIELQALQTFLDENL